MSFIQVEPYCYRKVEESLKVKFFKRLHEFYKPDSKQFSNISYSTDASWKYSGVGCLLIRFLAKDEVSVRMCVCVHVCIHVCMWYVAWATSKKKQCTHL